MKRDMDLVRAILLAMEAGEDPLKMAGYDEMTLGHHCWLMIDGGLIDGRPWGLDQDPLPRGWPQSIRWEGHEFLDAVRDDETWGKTKTVATKTGAWSIGLLKDIAARIISTQVSQAMQGLL